MPCLHEPGGPRRGVEPGGSGDTACAAAAIATRRARDPSSSDLRAAAASVVRVSTTAVHINGPDRTNTRSREPDRARKPIPCVGLLRVDPHHDGYWDRRFQLQAQGRRDGGRSRGRAPSSELTHRTHRRRRRREASDTLPPCPPVARSQNLRITPCAVSSASRSKRQSRSPDRNRRPCWSRPALAYGSPIRAMVHDDERRREREPLRALGESVAATTSAATRKSKWSSCKSI